MRRCKLLWFFLMMVLVTRGMPGAGGPMPAWAAEEKAPPAVQEGNVGEKAEAQEEKKEEECPSTFGPIITDTAVPIDKGKFALQPTFGLAFTTHNFSPSWRRISPGGSFRSFGMDWKFTYGLWDNLEAFVVLPFVYNWANGMVAPGPRGERAASFAGLGDVNLTLKYRLVEESATLPTVTALFATDFPTGHYRRLNPGLLGVDEVGGGAYVFTTGLNLSKYIKPFIFYGNLWYSLGTAFRNDDGRQYPRDFVTVNLAAELPLSGKWVALLELTSFWDGGRLFGHKANVAPAALMSILPGIEYMATDKFSLAFGVNIDLIGKNGEAAVTPLLSMVYAF
jgi:hypothetical protein